jgi:glycosyltransferase involved in cell wall biosynthesis
MMPNTQNSLAGTPSPRAAMASKTKPAERLSRLSVRASAPTAGSMVLCDVALLTAGRDRPYALGLAAALAGAGVNLDFIGSNEVDSPELRNNPQIHFLNLRGDQRVDAGMLQKMSRVLVYYARLLAYAASARPRVFHILWNNKFEFLDRVILMLYYKALGKKIALTAHNVNKGERDGSDSAWNRWTLRFQYRMCDRIFVHTARMKGELVSGFGIGNDKVIVIPFGINRTVPDTAMTAAEARRRLGLAPEDRVILFFGNIAPYKGLEFLIEAFETAAKAEKRLRLVIAGRPKGSENYWSGLLEKINRSPARGGMILKIEYVPDAETEVYFKAADLLALPYTHIFQSGVLSLGYGFGLPVLAADVGSLKEEIIEGKTGFVFKARDAAALAQGIQGYFASNLYRELNCRRKDIQDFANERYSWSKVAAITVNAYSKLHQNQQPMANI